jgi:hypothetical protein
MRRSVLCITALFVFFSVSAFSQYTLYKPFTSFRLIQTEHFDIVFPKESEPSARLLASFADSVYDQVSSLLDIEVSGRIPVTFSPHTDSFNGYYTLFFNHIVLYDTPLDVEKMGYKNNLENLFLHELTHAVSLNTRSPFYKFMYSIFGNLASPSFENAPYFMVEGATVSFESLDGTGRVNDPRVKQYLRQAVHENKFLTPLQASGVFDLSIRPIGYWYEYGGLFSAWLQQAYGMEKYSQLWKEMGKDSSLSFFVYKSDFYRIFKKVYGVDFTDEWKKFSASFILDGIENNKDELSSRKYRYFAEREYFIAGLTARGDNLYYIESSESKIGVYNTQTGKTKTINAASGVYDIDISSDGKTMLLSGYKYIEDRTFAFVTEHRADNGRKTGRDFKGLYKARYFRGGVIGLRSELHNNCIVYENFNGESEILFKGNEALMFSGPQAVDNDRIAFIASIEGKRELWLYNYASRELFKIENTADDNKYWAYMRDLGVSEGKLFFSYNSDDRMYKLGIIDLEAMKAVLSGREFSGGVFSPVCAGEEIYYLAAFVSRNSLLRFPEPAGSVSGNRISLQLTKQESKDKKTASEPLYEGPSKPYIGLRYINPLKFWFPLPLIRQKDKDNDFSVKLDGGGIITIMADPTDRNLVYLLAYADVPYKMAMIDQFVWQNTGLGFPLSLNFSDKVKESGEKINRQTSASISGSIKWTGDQWNNQFMLGGGYARNARYEDGKNAYEWGETKSGFFIQTGFVFSFRRLSLQFSGLSLTDSFEPHIDMIFSASTKTRFPLSFTFFGAYDKGGMDLHGKSNTLGSSSIEEFAMEEYSHPSDLNLFWLGGANIAVGLFSFEIQKNLSHLYFNRISGSLSVRNQIYDAGGNPDAPGIEANKFHLVQSLRLKLVMKTSVLPVVKYPLSIEPYFLGAWKFSDFITGKKDPWFFDFGVNASF